MAVNQETPIGEEGDYHFGPGNIYINATTGFIPAGFPGAKGTALYIGKTGPMEVSIPSTYVEAQSIQTGTEMDDAAVGGQKVEISTVLKEGGLDRIEQSIDGISVERNSAGEPIRWGYVNVIGKTKRANAFQLTFVEIQSGLEQWTNPFLVLDFFETVSMSAETVITVNAESFREAAVVYRALPSTTIKDADGRQAYFLSRGVAA